MGCVPDGANCGPHELPRHETRIVDPFDMMDREVASVDFQAFATATGRQMPRQPDWYADPTHPVVNVRGTRHGRIASRWVAACLLKRSGGTRRAAGLEGRMYPGVT